MSNLPQPIDLTHPLPARPIPDRHYTSKESAEEIGKKIEKLEAEAQRYLNADIPIIGNVMVKNEVWECEVVRDDKDYEYKGICIYSPFHKLFETDMLIGAKLSVVQYIMKRIVGYSSYFKCPAIIIRDGINRVVDIAYYRPQLEGKKLPKYLYKSNEKKPIKRGDHFLYPFQIEMERLIAKNNVIFIGEGLKNALNALAYEIPYISIEGAANKPGTPMIEYIARLQQRGKSIFTAFDGDDAGYKVYEAFCEIFDEEFVNAIEPDSGDDFTDYIKEVYQGI